MLFSPAKVKVAIIPKRRNEVTPKKHQNIEERESFGLGEGVENLESGPFTYHFAEFTLDVGRGCLLKLGKEVKLRPKVYEALKYLVENPGRLIGKQEFMQAIWPDSFVTDDSLVQCTIELRRALDDRDQQLVKTVPRRGYLFTASVSRSGAENEAPPAVPSATAAAPALAATPKKRVDLPKPRTSLIGREQELAQATALLRQTDVRLLTFTGAGGAGKTRLAIAVASAIAPEFSAGVQYVGLASIPDADLVGNAVAKALDLQHATNASIPRMVSEYLQDSGPFLFVLDNFEQVLPAATLVAEMLAACPTLKVLVTSRACLRLYGEQEFPVAPLDQPSAVQLFVQRATAVRPNFAMTTENSAAIGGICSRLDCLPLAIELAAARTKLLAPVAILDRLQNRLQLLTGGALDLPERQQTLRNTIDWSHDLLNEAEQKLFRRLSVFVGGCTIEAAEAVCNTGLDLGIAVFDGLSSLMDKNLVQRMDLPDSEARFTMLETIREYAMERLVSSGEEAAARRAHAAYCLVLAEEGNPELNPAERALWLSRCDLEIDNFRSALDWLLATRSLEWALRVCMALFRFWDMREHLAEGRSRLETVLQLAGNDYTQQRARIGVFLGALTTALGDFPGGRRFSEMSLGLYEELNDRWGAAASLNALAIGACDSGDYDTAQGTFERCLQFWRALDNPLETARCLHNLANVAKLREDFFRAQVALREATAIFEQVGDRSGAAWSINQQGD
ncbi:MAG: winged helix-turn-helix domain-containing protein, partial [Acidobacteriaceae bacterium]|nr:winged helix-turn-helix domain-containing protein [Acidobacteriaceae bacterium]